MGLLVFLRAFLIIFPLVWIYTPHLRAESVPFENPAMFPEQEAGEWLSKIEDIDFLAGANFKTKKIIERFVARLYRAGSRFVGVVIVMGDAAGFRVYLPVNESQREEIFKIVNRELSLMGYPAEDDCAQDNVAVWFKQKA